MKGILYNIQVIVITYATKGAYKVGSEVNNLQDESTVWTYCVHIFSLAFLNVGLQCVLVSRETSL